MFDNTSVNTYGTALYIIYFKGLNDTIVKHTWILMFRISFAEHAF